MRYLLSFFLVLILLACAKKEDSGQDVLVLRTPQETGIAFTNTIQNTEDFNIFSYRNFYNGGGVALGDVNNDGFIDVYLTANMGPNKLFLNQGDFTFTDVTAAAGVAGNKGWSTGVVMVDINQDELLDIYVCNAGYVEGDDQANELFINQGDGTFVEQAAQYNLDEKGYTTHAGFFDYDLDGDLDVYILNNSFIPVNTLNYSNKRDLRADDWPVKDFLKGGGDKLLRNDNGRFVDVSEEAGIYGSLVGFGLGITIGDINGDIYPDMYVSNDFFERDYLYINQGDGTFKEDIKNWMQHISLSSMGADMADLNNDDYPEIFVTEMLPETDERRKTTTTFENYNTYYLKLERDFYHQYMQNTLQLNNKDQTFSEIAYYSGVSASDWSWGALMFDVDNDGYRDLYVCNGVYQDVTDQDFIDFFANDVVQKMALTGEKEEIQTVIDRMPSNPQKNKLYVNQGDMTFADKGEAWGIDQPSFSNGAAYGDLDNDGDLDLVVNNLNMESFVFENRSDQLFDHHYLTIDLRGPAGNTRAIGAKVKLHRGQDILNFQMIPSRGFQSSIDYRMTFGLGQKTDIDSVVVIWPDRTSSVIADNIPLDTIWSLDYQAVPKRPFREKPGPVAANRLLEPVDLTFAAHQEDEYIDFFQEGLTMRMLSREGPCMDVGDVNGDGRDDVFIGGAAGQAAELYLQAADGSFQVATAHDFDNYAAFEDTAARFFDADGDGDLDLFVGSGGNQRMVRDRLLLDRLYLNDGTGAFALNARAFPPNGYNTADAEPLDVDGDGLMDLMVASRSVPQKYGLPPQSYVYRNQGDGTFADATDELAPELKRAGMLTDITVVDVDGDQSEELVVVGEWMAPLILTRRDGVFVPMTSGLESYSGWWYVAKTVDVDGDGDQDLVLGNRGENFYFTGSPGAPAKLWVADFDNNKTVEKIISYTVDGEDKPVPMKRELTNELVKLKKENLKHTDYATRTMQDLFEPDVLKKALVREGTWFKSAVAINDGQGKFTVQALPDPVQFSCVCDIHCTDLNGDGLTDVLLAGNDSGFMPQFSKLDASYGHVLLNQGDGTFARMENRTSGFFVDGEVRAMHPIQINGETYFIVGKNNEKPQVFRFVNQPGLVQ